jgi:hypothetical protein
MNVAVKLRREEKAHTSYYDVTFLCRSMPSRCHYVPGWVRHSEGVELHHRETSAVVARVRRTKEQPLRRRSEAYACNATCVDGSGQGFLARTPQRRSTRRQPGARWEQRSNPHASDAMRWFLRSLGSDELVSLQRDRRRNVDGVERREPVGNGEVVGHVPAAHSILGPAHERSQRMSCSTRPRRSASGKPPSAGPPAARRCSTQRCAADLRGTSAHDLRVRHRRERQRSRRLRRCRCASPLAPSVGSFSLQGGLIEQWRAAGDDLRANGAQPLTEALFRTWRCGWVHEVLRKSSTPLRTGLLRRLIQRFDGRCHSHTSTVAHETNNVPRFCRTNMRRSIARGAEPRRTSPVRE